MVISEALRWRASIEEIIDVWFNVPVTFTGVSYQAYLSATDWRIQRFKASMRSTHRSLAFLDQRLNCPNPLQEEHIRSSKLAPFVCSPNRCAKWLGGPPNLQVEQCWGGRNEDQGPNHSQEASLASCAVGFFGCWCDRWWWLPEKHSMGIIILRGESQKSLKPTGEPNRLDDFHLSNAAFSYLQKFFKNLWCKLPPRLPSTSCKWQGHVQIYFQPTFQVGYPQNTGLLPHRRPSQQQGLTRELRVI